MTSDDEVKDRDDEARAFWLDVDINTQDIEGYVTIMLATNSDEARKGLAQAVMRRISLIPFNKRP
ncbi:MAG: hypothetical protein ACPGNT_01165 [Rhodospirillales bacterium]